MIVRDDVEIKKIMTSYICDYLSCHVLPLGELRAYLRVYLHPDRLCLCKTTVS